MVGQLDRAQSRENSGLHTAFRYDCVVLVLDAEARRSLSCLGVPTDGIAIVTAMLAQGEVRLNRGANRIVYGGIRTCIYEYGELQ